jgi:hypothetical protein
MKKAGQLRPASLKKRHSGTGKKIFTTNNHYEWSKLPVVPDMPYLNDVPRAVQDA